jgi:zinc/manganese transport system ATP-binding protein
MKTQIQFSYLTLGYDRHPAVLHLNGAVEEGALLAIIGPNGAGKSTQLKGIVGVIKPLAGNVAIETASRREIAYLPQVNDIDRRFPITVYDMIAMGLWRQAGVFGGVNGTAHKKIQNAIAAVGLTGFEQRPIGGLSGGQMQRMLFARLLLQDARIIVLDEPFNAIDDKTVEDLLALIGRWHREKRTVLAALHDIELVRANFPQALLLAREPVAWGDTADVLQPANLRKARQMCEAFDEEAQECVETRAA